jgi:hypothetical protein
LVPAVTLLTLGCYAYAPAELSSVAPGQTVRIQITQAAAARIRDATEGAAPIGVDGLVVSGSLVGRDGGRFMVSVPAGVPASGLADASLFQELDFSPSEIEKCELRRLDPVRTGLAVVGATGGAAGVVLGILSGGREPVQNPPGPPTTDARLP